MEFRPEHDELNLAFPACVLTLPPQTPHRMFQTRYFFGYYYFCATA